MYDRGEMSQLPFPFYEIPAHGMPVHTLDFLQVMASLLENMQGLAATSYAGSLSNELAYQELTQALQILRGYSEAACVLFNRWIKTQHPGPAVNESGEDDGDTLQWRPQDAG